MPTPTNFAFPATPANNRRMASGLAAAVQDMANRDQLERDAMARFHVERGRFPDAKEWVAVRASIYAPVGERIAT